MRECNIQYSVKLPDSAATHATCLTPPSRSLPAGVFSTGHLHQVKSLETSKKCCTVCALWNNSLWMGIAVNDTFTPPLSRDKRKDHKIRMARTIGCSFSQTHSSLLFLLCCTILCLSR